MAYRVLEVTLLSAKDLKSVNLITRMEVYAVATISGDPITRQCTPPDPYGGRHPTWNATLRFAVPPTAAAASGCLHILLRTERSLGDRDVGEVIVPLSEVLAGACPRDLGPRPPQFASYQVRKVHRTETRGVLHLSYRLGAVLAPQVPQPQGRAADEPVIAYPVPRPFHPQPYAYLPPAPLPPPPPSPRASAHMAMPPPSPQASGHMPMPPPSPHDMPPPPPKAYGHLSMPPSPSLQASGRMATPPPPPKASGNVSVRPPTPPKASGNVSVRPPTPPKASGHVSMPPASPSPGAGYVAAPQPPKTAGYEDYSPWTAKNMGNADFGMGLSAGLVGGAIGGMMAGDMVSDAAAYNAGYRAGLAADWGKAVY